jgi:hypothetical protein
MKKMLIYDLKNAKITIFFDENAKNSAKWSLETRKTAKITMAKPNITMKVRANFDVFTMKWCGFRPFFTIFDHFSPFLIHFLPFSIHFSPFSLHFSLKIRIFPSKFAIFPIKNPQTP